MDTLETAIRLMTPGCFMTSIDLRDAYYSVPIAPEHQKYLKFFWQDQLYAFNCLPMGLLVVVTWEAIEYIKANV